MDYTLVRVFAYSIALAAVIGIIRCRQIDPVYYPFLFLIWLGLFNEGLSHFLTWKGYHNTINSNIFALAESLLITWFFKRLGLFDRKPLTFYVLSIFFILAWLIDNFRSNFSHVSSYFIICFSFAISLMSVSMINMLIAKTKKLLIRNATFLICLGFITYYTYSVLVEIFFLYGLEESSKEFSKSVYRILIWINLVVNLIYALAILWAPRRHGYLLR